MTKAWKTLLAVAGMALLSAGLALAQTTPAPGTDATTVKVQPALFEQVVNPGDVISTSITVSNPDPVARTYTVSVQDISGLSVNGEPVFQSSSVPEYGISSWVTIPKGVITIPSNGSAVVPFTVNVPKDAVPGGHYGAIFVTYGATRPQFTGTGIGYQVGSLLEFRIAGQANETAEIRSFSTGKGLYQSPNVTFTTDVADTGNVLLRPRGPIEITNMFGQNVGTVVMNQNADGVFPGQDRTFSVDWTGSGMMMGRFDAVMSLTYGDTAQKTVSEETSFWVIPIMPILALLASILFFVFIFIWSVRAYVRRKVAGMTEGRHGNAASVTAEERFLAEDRLPFSRLLFILVSTAIFALVFLLVLFFFFG